MKSRILLLFVFLHLYSVCAQQIGRPVIRYFNQKSYAAHPQNYCALQDKRGIVYVGNNDGLLEFDGLNWRLIQTANKSGIRCLCIDSSGIVFAGANNDFGFLTYDAQGNTIFQSLSQLSHDNHNDIGIVWKAVATKNAVYFLCSENIFVFDYKKLTRIAVSLMPQYGFGYQNRLYIFTENGLGVVDNNSVISIPETEWIYDNNIALPLVLSDGKIFLVGDITGLSFFDNEKSWDKPLSLSTNTDATSFIENAVPYCIIETSKHSIAIGSLSDGLLEIDPNSDKTRLLNKNNGMSDNTVIGLFSDSHNNVWALLNNGIDIILLNKPLIRTDVEDGLSGAVMAVGNLGNTQYAATYTGLMERNINETKFRQVAGIGEVCWSLLNFKNSLLVSHEFEILKITHNNISRINTGKTTYCFGRHKQFPNVVFLGQDGLSAVLFDNNNVNADIQFPEIPDTPIRKIEEGADGTLWLTSEFNGLYGIRFGNNIKDYNIEHIDTSSGLKTMLNNYVHCIGKRTIIGSPEGILEIIGSTKIHRIISPADFDSTFTNKNIGVSQLINVNDTTIWANTHIGIGQFIKRKESYVFVNTIPLGLIPDAFRIFLDDSLLWITTGEGLYSYNVNEIPDNLPFTANIRNVFINGDSVLFAGAFINSDFEQAPLSLRCQTKIPEIAYRYNNLSFEYAGFSYENPEENQYSYYLEGYEKNWHKWSFDTRKEYTNLKEGEYCFKVRCKNNYGIISNTSEYRFVILPPWYRTPLAYTLYVLASFLLIFAIVRLNSMRLRKANIRLEKIVVERTAVIANQKKEITDSIEYAARIQKSILPNNNLVEQIINDFFILNLPRDIVSGDFYWVSEQGERKYFCIADCTGHGVPGAFMSMLGVSALNQIISQNNEGPPSFILNQLRSVIIDSLHQEGKSGENADGMDIALCCYYPKSKILQYSGAHISLFLVRDCEMIEIKGNKMPVGTHILQEQGFDLHEEKLVEGDMIYLFSDGFADQFGGPSGKKYSNKQLKSLLISISKLEMAVQKERLHQELINWLKPNDKNEPYDRMDDIIIFGIRV
ncbi:MAG: hypothetical protein CVU11_07815 [Bacteroidetes bacterium HGW-Bacteroidetes-6]|nr:MAG: hypothetical protein CVU11_07815 [Bacteroidetes bacterium HGW-Bacteroidetes-6]